MIVTFYSYKGGTGRTMALANIAILLARAGKRVLAVDFDLEAPGLGRFFQDLQPNLVAQDGLLDMLIAQSQYSSGVPRAVDWRDYVNPVRFDGGWISLITSGRSDDRYPARVLDFDWQYFFRHQEGGSFIEKLRNEWTKEYDFTLIDSRTGITDIGGVCTIALPDLIVAVFVANHQNIEGILDVLKRAQEGRQSLAYDRAPALVLPVLSRFDIRTEYESANEWLELLGEKLSTFYDDWLPESIPPRRILEKTKLPYIAYFSFGEKLPVLHQGISDPESLGYAFNSISRLIETHLRDAAAVAGDGSFSRPETNPAKAGKSLHEPLSSGLMTPAMMPAIIGGVPPLNPNFTGREEILQRLKEELRLHSRAQVLPQTLQGLGGVGKTQLAVEYVHRFQSEYELIWWVNADDDQSIRRSLVSLARRLGLSESDNITSTIDTLLDELRAGKPYRNWMLVYDGAAEPQDIRRYLPSGPGQILITSRSRSWLNDSAIIEVDVFTEQESSEFLMRRWTGISVEDALTLASELGHLPLALDQAVAVHRETGMPLVEYLLLLRERPARILAAGEPSGYPRSVAMTCQLAFKQLKEHSLAAAQLLEVCSFISSQNIAVPMLVRGRGASLPSPLAETLHDDINLRTAIRDIGRYALAQLDPGRDFIRIHMLVRALLRDRLSVEQRQATERSAHELLALANPGAPDDESTWSQHRQMAPHILPSGVMHSPDPAVRRIVLDQIRYFYVIGDYSASFDLAERAVDVWHESIGPDNEMTLLATFHLGNALRAVGEYRRARVLNEEILRSMQRVLGPDHEYTLRMSGSHAADLRLLGDFRQALRLDEENIDRYRGTLGEDNPAVLRCANNLAVDLRLLGRFRESLAIDEVNLQQRRFLLGESHPEAVASVTSVIRDLYGIGEYENALKLARESFARCKDMLKGHAFLLLLQFNLAILLRKVGHHAEAASVSEDALERSHHRLGAQHEYTLSARVTLANALRVLGDLTRALQMNEWALDMYRDSFGREHPFTLACANNLTIVYRAIGRVGEATELDRTIMDALERTLGPDHPYTLCSLTSLSNDLSMDGDGAGAKELSALALERSRRQRGIDHPYTLACAVNLAFDLDATDSKTEAAALREDTRERMRLRLGPEHPETVNMERGRRAECETEISAT